MMVIALAKWRRRIVWILAAVLIAAVVVVVYQQKNVAKVDRSNAMQVTKAVAPDIAPVVTSDFFTEYRLERDKLRSERSELLRDIMKNTKSDETRQRAQDSVLKLTVNKQKESDMENLIKARGFADALVFIQDSSVSAVVKTSSLSRDEVLQVAEVISRVCGIKPEEITVSAKP